LFNHLSPFSVLQYYYGPSACLSCVALRCVAPVPSSSAPGLELPSHPMSCSDRDGQMEKETPRGRWSARRRLPFCLEARARVLALHSARRFALSAWRIGQGGSRYPRILRSALGFACIPKASERALRGIRRLVVECVPDLFQLGFATTSCHGSKLLASPPPTEPDFCLRLLG
jgi:hypothetical protein